MGLASLQISGSAGFRCCYCYAMNPARKQRPHAPKLEFPAPPVPASPQKQPVHRDQQQAQETDDDDDDDEDESEDEDGDESGSNGEQNGENEDRKATNSSEETQGEASSQSVPKREIIKNNLVNQDLKFADEDVSDERNAKAEVAKEDRDQTQEATVKAELRTE